MFNLNQIVKGHKAGTFVIVGIRHDLGSETHYQVKEYNERTGKARRSEMALPESALREAA